MKKGILITSITILALACAGAVAAEHEMGGPPPPPPREGPFRDLIEGQMGRLMVLKSEINLTREQRDKIRDILMSHRMEGAQALAGLVTKAQAVRGEATAEHPDEKAIRAAADDLGKAIGDAAVLASKVRTEVNPILTDEQRKLVDEFRSGSQAGVTRWITKMLEHAKNPPPRPEDDRQH